jgi:microcystin degradation protein MlrC
MRIATGGISHETSTFARKPTTLKEFASGLGLYRGPEILERFRGANICTGGFIDGAARHGFELVPLLWTFAYPSGLIPRPDYEALKSEFLERLRAEESRNGRVDGVLLDLHGAMVVDGIDDGDGDFLAAVREAVGPDRPIVATFDLHGNHTQRRVEAATAVIGFDTYPHVDMAERGREAADLIVAVRQGRVRPVSALRKLPFFWSAARQVTAHQPIDEAFRLVHEVEQRPGILTVTLSTGFPWADVPDLGPSVIVAADGDRALAEHTAQELADWIWERRSCWHEMPPSAAEALERGERMGRYPIMLADQSDNTGGGAPGDSTEVLRLFLERRLQDALLLYLVDAEVAAKAHALGVGARITTPLGGKSDPVQGPPVDFDGEVMALSDGIFHYDGPMYAGVRGNLGTSAWLRSGGVHVVVVSATMQPLDQAFARSLGIDCARMRYIALKSAVHFRSGFERLGGSIQNINARAIHSHDFARLTYRKARPMYPVGLQ